MDLSASLTVRTKHSIAWGVEVDRVHSGYTLAVTSTTVIADSVDRDWSLAMPDVVSNKQDFLCRVDV